MSADPELAAIAACVSAAQGRAWSPSSRSPLGGGIHRAERIASDDGPSVFVKFGDAHSAPRFHDEAADLAQLAATGVVRTPRVMGVAQTDAVAMLVLEAVEQASPTREHWQRAGEMVAALHRHTAEAFGLDRDNWIGQLPQTNAWRSDWPTFYADCRLTPMARRARDEGQLDRSDIDAIDRLIRRLPDLVGPPQPPALIHGDLWGGNLLFDADGPVLIDPAVYFGHREMEIAFNRMFGGFHAAYFDAYQSNFPLADGHDDRTTLCQIYPLLVHVVHFGGGYVGSLRSAVGRYV